MLSKELFKEVMGIDYDIDFGFIKGKQVNYIATELIHSDISAKGKSINMHELGSKGKEWAYREGFLLTSGIRYGGKIYCDVFVPYVFDNAVASFKDDTEPKAIFKALEWIKEQQGNDLDF